MNSNVIWDTRRIRALFRAVLRTNSASERAAVEGGHPLFAALAEDLGVVRFVQIGSNDTQFGDPLRPHFKAGGWEGVLVEAVPYICERVRQVYAGNPAIQVAQVAIAEQRGMRKFFALRPATANERPDLPVWYDQLGSFEKSVLLKSVRDIPDLDQRIIEIQVPCETFSSLCERYRLAPDLVHIDTEGYDGKIVLSMDFVRYKPKLLVFEHEHLPEAEYAAVLARLRQYRYQCVRWRRDTVCLRQGLWQLLAPRTRSAWRTAWQRERSRV